jgi:hypothetical protein
MTNVLQRGKDFKVGCNSSVRTKGPVYGLGFNCTGIKFF